MYVKRPFNIVKRKLNNAHKVLTGLKNKLKLAEEEQAETPTIENR